MPGPEARAERVLNQDQPFHCSRCGKAFGNRRMVENKLRECVERDRARTKVLRISPFGLIEMMRTGEIAISRGRGET